MRRAQVWFCACMLLCAAGTASAQVFHEDFDGTALDPSVWLLELGNGSIVVADGVATLSCNGGEFPVATTLQDPFPSGDFRIKARLRYPSVSGCGVGFGALDNFWELYHGEAVCRPFLTWRDAGGWYSYTGSPAYYYIGGPNTDFHLYEWTYIDGRYTFYLDGVLVSFDDCATRPTRIFFGHPHPISCGPWTSIETDYIHIESLSLPTGADRAAWGAVKARYH